MRTLFRRTRGRLVDLLAAYRSEGVADPLLLPPLGSGPLSAADGIPVVPVGFSFPVRLNGSLVNLGLPVDITSRLEKLFIGGDFDLVHVHEPLAPSVSFTALREARSPVVATFHLTPVGMAAYEMAESVLGRFFARLDARVVTFPEAGRLLDELYPGEYQVISCGTELESVPVVEPAPEPVPESAPRGQGESLSGPRLAGSPFALYVYRGDARRSYRALQRALLAGFPRELERVVVALHRPSLERWVPRTVPRRLRSRVTLVEFDTPPELLPWYQRAVVTILPFLGGEWLCTCLAEAAVTACPLVGPDLAPVRDFLAQAGASTGPDQPWGAVFSPSESGALARAVSAVLSAVVPAAGRATVPADPVGVRADPVGVRADPVGVTADPAGVTASRDAVSGPLTQGRPRDAAGELAAHRMTAVAESLESLYLATLQATRAARGQGGRTPAAARSLHLRGLGEESPRKRARMAALATRPDWINADLHMHSNFSKDCTSSIATILRTAREVGLGAIAIADHNEIKGALLAREMAEGDPFVIVAEEIKTSEGEVIGLFLQELIPKGLSFDQTVSLIKEQGGLVYVPHPFDALRTTPSYRTLVDNLHRIDVIEVYNAKVALSSFNLGAERFAAKYNIVAGAGSDAHVPQAIGTAMLHMPRFHDQQSFMAALWEADIIARRKSLLYLQSLKLLRTTLDRVLPED
jgi:predicted metal-dependent phosphoesterase TrpH